MKTILNAGIYLVLIILTNVYPQENGTWQILNEGIKGDFRTMDFVNEDIGWLAGNDGILFKTLDAGENWIRIPEAKTLNISWDISNSIDFVNDSIGWALGGLFVAMTRDGGHSWSIKMRSSNYRLMYINAVNDSVVYVLRYNNLIFKTIDCGENWYGISLSKQNRFLQSVRFFDSEIGIVTGYYEKDPRESTMLRTFDGGKTWHEKIYPEYDEIYDLQFIDDSTGYLIASKNQGESEYLIYTSSDTFNTWSTLFSNDRRIHSIHVIDFNTIYADISDSTAWHNIMLSEDGGKTWQKIFSSRSSYINGIYAVNKDLVFVFGGQGLQSNAGGALLKTMNAGQDWIGQILSYPFQDVQFLNRDEGIAAGGWAGVHESGGEIFVTQNGGKTWYQTLSPGYSSKACTFVNDSVGFIISSYIYDIAYLYKTKNRGKDWFEVFNYRRAKRPDSLDHWSPAVNDIWFINENIAWAVGDDDNWGLAVIMGTTDGGKTWQVEWQYPWPEDYIGEWYTLSSVHFASDTTGWAVGESGLMVKYSDKDRWQIQPRITDLPLKKVFFSDERHGWIAGGYSNDTDHSLLLFKTEDGGESWQEITGVDYLLRDIFFQDNLHGWAVGEDLIKKGVILESKDGGYHWTVQVEDLIAPLNAIHFKDGYGWAVGELGLVLRTEDGTTWIDDKNNKVYPNAYNLYQNYPNPFNPKTVISWNVGATHESPSLVDLSIYNVLGQKVTTLVNEKQKAGFHSVEWDAGGLASGVYYYRLQAEGFVVTKKLVLLR